MRTAAAPETTRRRWFHRRRLSPGGSTAQSGLLETTWQRVCEGKNMRRLFGSQAAPCRHTVKVTGVLFSLQLRDEFSFLPQESVPVQTQEEQVHFYLGGSRCGQEGKWCQTGLTGLSAPVRIMTAAQTLCVK